MILRIPTIICFLFAVTLAHANVDAQSATNESYVNVLYFPNKSLGFGHVALEIFLAENDSATPNFYLSWARQNDREMDYYHHTKPKIARLPLPKTTDLDQFVTWYIQSEYCGEKEPDYGSAYQLLENNCAHAVLKALRHLGYDIKTKDRRFALRPKKIYRIAQNLSRDLHKHALIR